MRIVGIDLGTRKAALAEFNITARGVVTLRSCLAVYVHPTQRGKELSRLSHDVGEICAHANYVFIEEPLVGRGVKASMQISQTAGAIMANLATRGIHNELVNVKHWKKDVVGNGNASKEMIKMWLNTHHTAYDAACEGDQDKVDACCIGLFGIATLERVDSLGDWGEDPGA